MLNGKQNDAIANVPDPVHCGVSDGKHQSISMYYGFILLFTFFISEKKAPRSRAT